MAGEVRIDKWMWAVRIFKTRSIAAEYCKKGKVSIGNAPVKASRCVKVGDVLNVRKPPITYSFKVIALTEKRMGAKAVPQFMENVTPQEQLDILQVQNMSGFVNREKGTGRPTKKERRELDAFTLCEDEEFDEFDFDDED
ncbi:MAG TPA: heat-shock protein Hsp15 [Porphyromonadaceae bacterium]|nr:heat-shock protein Hsp15 [Porphyromonadaceae bacterium]